MEKDSMGIDNIRSEIVGIDTPVPLLDGSRRRYVYLDNAASTPTFKRVLKRIEEFMPWYSGVHRGTGFKSEVATQLYDSAHDVCGRFVGANPDTTNVIFLKNTTECINKLAHRFNFKKDDIVVTTAIEHHSNDLPWRKVAKVIRVGADARGCPDLNEMRDVLQRHRARARLVAVNGASNITGICSPIYEVAALAHEAGAQIFVDAAQLVAHRRVDMLPDDDPRHIDFLAYSGHKIYAPFGTGVLIGPMKFFAQGEPDIVGGGVAAIVTLDRVEWNPAPHRDEAGSPNVVGGIALAEAICVLKQIGMDAVSAHEQRLLAYTLKKLKKISKIVLYGPVEALEEKVGVIAFNVEGMHPGLVGAILGAEGGIGVRTGYFCAQPYVKQLLNVDAAKAQGSGCGVVTADIATFPGMVRASFGCYSDESDVDAFSEMVERITRKEYRGTYVQDQETGAFYAQGFRINYEDYFVPFEAKKLETHRRFSETAWG
jgi:selenocysteine lyase/cysteine desulfurase